MAQLFPNAIVAFYLTPADTTPNSPYILQFYKPKQNLIASQSTAGFSGVRFYNYIKTVLLAQIYINNIITPSEILFIVKE
jgi:hypothetical protein